MSDLKKGAARLAAIEARIDAACVAAGRDRSTVTLVAVSKTHDDDAVEAVAAAGQRDFGESQIQAWLARLDATDPAIRWHLIGPIQSNKAKFIARSPPHLIHTLDRPSLVLALDKTLTTPVDALIQVNIDREPQKTGCDPDTLDALADQVAASPHLRLGGLMCIPRADVDPRNAFARLRDLGDAVQDRVDAEVVALSMGMSGDFEAAIAEGATHVRVGTAIFGGR